MGRFIRYPLALSILLAAVFAAGAQAQDTAASGGLDLAKTRQLFLDWTLRERFPDTVTLGYYNAYVLHALGTPLSGQKAEAVVKFVRASQRDDGGFVSNPKFGENSNLIFTFYALKALRMLGALDSVDRERAAQYVVGLVQDDGGISPSLQEKGRGSLASTFYGVGALDVLGRVERLDRDKTRAFVLAHRGNDDGFGMTPHGTSSPQAVALAMHTLAVTGGIPDEIRADTIRYMEGAVEFLGTLGTRYRALATMQTAVGIVQALGDLDALDEVDTEKVARFVKALYIPENGGFGPSPGLGTTPPSTYQGVLCLTELGAKTTD